jgi:hypothetical protein
MLVLKTVIYTGKLLGFQNLPVPRQNDIVGLAVRRASQALFSDFLAQAKTKHSEF